jgi:ABC-type nitrate/sulfonate/bicarbonate transport system ATPase subunit
MIELREVSCTYVVDQGSTVTETDAVVDVDLTVPPRQFVSIVGASGSGKTTLLRLVAGLERPTTGQVRVDGRPVTGPGADRAVVFQDAALYPWRTVRANVRLGLELSGLAEGEEAATIVDRQIALVGLQQFADQYPSQLSGGMRQRVGLARALAVSPPTLLMDEPFGALDAINRARMADELLRIWESDRRTVLFVTHSLDEALHLSDRIVVMRSGRVVDDTPVDLSRPRDPDDGAYLELRHFLKGVL